MCKRLDFGDYTIPYAHKFLLATLKVSSSSEISRLIIPRCHKFSVPTQITWRKKSTTHTQRLAILICDVEQVISATVVESS